jgi:hypothetical protein
MMINKLNKKGVIYLNKSIKLIEEMKKNEDYFECIKVIKELIIFFNEDNEFCKILNQLKKITETLWEEKIKNKLISLY